MKKEMQRETLPDFSMGIRGHMKITYQAYTVGVLLLVLGMASSVRAQLECPLPEGVTPLAPPPVTAQQVEDGSASLTDFALAVRDIFVSEPGITSLKELAYVGCLLRQEGGPWRAGNIYVTRQVPSPRIFIHAKDQSLSGRQLKPEIYAGILHALGIDPAVLASAEETRAAFTEAATGTGALFDLPDIPGASGYAVPLISGASGHPVIVSVGFDLDVSHLAPVELEHIEPPVTAAEVVDRDSLKAFVTAAGEYYIELVASGDANAVSNARVVFRDENGPWVHGSVYIAITERVSRFIHLHGGFPNRFELRQSGTVRHIVTGELVAEQVYRAAESDPEGGFVEYYFDDPDDEFDRLEVPKVGYARVFTARLPRPDGSILTTDYIVNSGFYPSVEDVELRGRLENPGAGSFQSGVGALWGWVCDAELVEFQIETAQGEVEWYPAMYGMERLDTQDACGDTNNGFVSLANWNRFGAGRHTVTTFVNRIVLDQAAVQVTTLGEGAEEEFLRGAVGECVVEGFPYPDETTTLEWQQESQNFVITDVR